MKKEIKLNKIEKKIKHYLSTNSNGLYQEYLQFLKDNNYEDNLDNEFNFSGYILERFINENDIEDNLIEDTILLFLDLWGSFCF